tara:strand:+ start:330 stop:470 length:141 start_codon:yes stop_codon:yes gene_type:complete
MVDYCTFCGKKIKNYPKTIPQLTSYCKKCYDSKMKKSKSSIYDDFF